MDIAEMFEQLAISLKQLPPDTDRMAEFAKLIHDDLHGVKPAEERPKQSNVRQGEPKRKYTPDELRKHIAEAEAAKDLRSVGILTARLREAEKEAAEPEPAKKGTKGPAA